MSEYRIILYQYITTGIGALVILCNGLMIVYIRRARSYTHNPIGYVYIVNTAATDLLVGFDMVLLKSMHPYMATDLAGNKFAKELYHVLRFGMLRFSLLTSVLNLVALTIDRLFAVRFPFLEVRRSVKLHVKICIGIWLVSLLLTSLFYTYTRFYLIDTEKYKDVIFPIATLPATVLFVVSYILIFSVVNRSSNVERQLALCVHRSNPTTEINENRSAAMNQSISIQREKVGYELLFGRFINFYLY